MSLVFIFREKMESPPMKGSTHKWDIILWKKIAQYKILHEVSFSLEVLSKCLIPDTDQSTLSSQS